MSITRDFKLSLVAGRSVPLVINANQYDDGEVWRFTLLDENGQKYSPSTGSIIGLKSDGHIIANAGTVSSTGLVIIPETEQMTASPGKNFYELLIDDDTHGTANFTVLVEPRPGAGGTPSDSDLAVFQEAIDAAAQIGDTSELVDDVAVLKSRMDEFTTLTDGSTTGDAELADIRVGADGTTYPNAGDAVRGQYSELKNAVSYIADISIASVAKEGFYVSDGAYIGTSTNSEIHIIDLDAVTAKSALQIEVSSTSNRCRLLFTNVSASEVGYGTVGTYVDKGNTTKSVSVDYATWSQYKSLVVCTNYQSAPLATITVSGLQAIQDVIDEIEDVKEAYLNDSNLIEGSQTNNVLDTNDVINDYRLSDDYPYFIERSGCVTSKAIFVKDKGFVTIRSNNTSSNIRWVLFKTNSAQDASGYVGVSSAFSINTDGTKTDYVITVPSNAVYMFVCLKPVNGGNNWVNDTIAYGAIGTNDAYEGGELVGINSASGKPLIINTNGNNQSKHDIVKCYLDNKITAEYAPISVGAPNRITANEQYERVNLAFFSDSHIDSPASRAEYSMENVNDVVEFVNESEINFDAVIHAGDIVTGGGVITQADWINSMKPFFDAVKKSSKPVIFSIGNHDTNDWGNTPANAMDDTAWGTAWLNWAETNMGIVRQTKSNSHKSTWHYRDIDSKKIRIISIDVQDTDKSATDNNGKVLYNGGTAWYISQEQMDWIIGTALNFDDKDDAGWGVIIVLHQTMNMSDSYYSTTVSPAYDSAISKLVEVCKAFNAQGTYTNQYSFATDSFYNLNISADFTRYNSEDEKPYIICMLVGHEHFDRVKTIDGINMIWIANGSCTDAYSDSRVARIPKTATQNLFNLISVDTTERKIRVVRYGAGKNCFGAEPYSFMPNGLSF